MHDWNAEVARNLKDIGLSAQEQQETISELGDYLQDRYEQALAEGMSDAKAVSYCLAEAGEWGQLGRKIRDAKHKDGAMNYRTKALWVPGLASFAAASILLMLLQRIVSLQPKVLWRDGGAIVLHPLWWLLLPLCGAVGAYLSRRAGGRRFTSLVAGLFPAIVMLNVFCAVLPVSIFVERNAFVIEHPTYFALTMVNWTVIPALALLIGAAPLCGKLIKPEVSTR